MFTFNPRQVCVWAMILGWRLTGVKACCFIGFFYKYAVSFYASKQFLNIIISITRWPFCQHPAVITPTIYTLWMVLYRPRFRLIYGIKTYHYWRYLFLNRGKCSRNRFNPIYKLPLNTCLCTLWYFEVYCLYVLASVDDINRFVLTNNLLVNPHKCLVIKNVHFLFNTFRFVLIFEVTSLGVAYYSQRSY